MADRRRSTFSQLLIDFWPASAMQTRTTVISRLCTITVSLRAAAARRRLNRPAYQREIHDRAMPPQHSRAALRQQVFERSALFRTEEVAKLAAAAAARPSSDIVPKRRRIDPRIDHVFTDCAGTRLDFCAGWGKCSEASPAGNFFVERVEKVDRQQNLAVLCHRELAPALRPPSPAVMASQS